MNKVLIGVLAVCSGIVIGVVFHPLISGDNIYNQVKKFDRVLQGVNKNYVEDVDTHKLVETAIKGMLDELDPHSIYISAEEMKKVNDEMRKGSFEGIGVEFDVIEDTLTVLSVIDGGPSKEAGILAGDKIIRVNNNTVIGIKSDSVTAKLKGPGGSDVALKIYRPGEKSVIDFTITRGEIPLNSIDTYFIIKNTDVGFIRLSKFSATTHQEMKNALKELKALGMNRLVLDLRGNPGGYLNQAVMVADEFIPDSDTIVYTKSRRVEFDEEKIATSNGLFEKSPLIVMIDYGSASASEIVSGAVQDLDRGLVAGITSFGKGLVQREYSLNDGSAYRLTISKYYTPSGRCIQRPYDDKEEYRGLAHRIDVDEGDNIEHSIEKLKKSFADEKDTELIESENYLIIKKYSDSTKKDFDVDSLPIHYTKSGRHVLGGGGIIPDYIINYSKDTELLLDLWDIKVFSRFIDSYMGVEGQKIIKKYEDDFSFFKSDFNVSAELISDLKKYSVAKGVRWDNEQYKEDEERIKELLKAGMARYLFGRERYLEIYFESDKMLQKSIELFPMAKKIAGL